MEAELIEGTEARQWLVGRQLTLLFVEMSEL
jgi:hypothetical protein